MRCEWIDARTTAGEDDCSPSRWRMSFGAWQRVVGLHDGGWLHACIVACPA